MSIKEKILDFRENRLSEIKKMKMRFKAVITLKTNTPGDNKNINISYILVNYFFKLVPLNMVESYRFCEGYDGPYFLIGSSKNPKEIKEALMDIEENHELGRFIDFDVFDGYSTLNRGYMRKCYICDKEAFVCIKEENHSIYELIEYMNFKTLSFLKKYICELVDDSMMLELDLHPKFGLVTPKSNGSHFDMNYNLMVKAKETIIPFFADMFEVGFGQKEFENIFNEIRKIGLNAEKAMLKSTKNINAYKGLIFNLGILCASYGYALFNKININNIFDIVKKISKFSLSDFKNINGTFGISAYKQFGILGARGEMAKGMPNVKKALNLLNDFSEDSRLHVLIHLISTIEDTVFLKRAEDHKKYMFVKNEFRNLNSRNKDDVEKLNRFCIENNLSFGGSADLLVLAIFIKKIV